MLPIRADHVRLFLHIVAACVWIGGQVVLAGLVPVLRRVDTDDRRATRAVARQFQRLAWPAFAVLLATGIWNLVDVHASEQSTQWLVTLFVKLVLVAVAGVGAGLHALLTGPAVTRATDPADLRRRQAMSGGLAGVGLLAALGAAFLGVQLTLH